jgi:hypothetical protein
MISAVEITARFRQILARSYADSEAARIAARYRAIMQKPADTAPPVLGPCLSRWHSNLIKVLALALWWIYSNFWRRRKCLYIQLKHKVSWVFIALPRRLTQASEWGSLKLKIGWTMSESVWKQDPGQRICEDLTHQKQECYHSGENLVVQTDR